MWHPYQSWHYHFLRTYAVPNLHWTSWLDGNSEWISRLVDSRLGDRKSRLRDSQEQIAEFYQLLHLLSVIEPYYLPSIRRRISYSISGDSSADYVNYVAWRRELLLDSVLNDTGLDVPVVKKWHNKMSVEAHRIDDTRDWYMLIRNASFRKRDRLRGSSRLAHDFYEMAEMLRMFLIDSVHETIPLEDEYIGGPRPEWQKQRYGLANGTTIGRTGLKRLTRDFGLDGSYRVFWYVEGETEMAFFTKLAEGFDHDLHELGIRLMNLGGTGRIEQLRAIVRKRLKNPNEVEQTAKAFSSDEVFTFLTIDDDHGISKSVDLPDVQRLFTGGIVVWDGDFEEANFTIPELIRAACRISDVEPDAVNHREIEEEIERQRARMDGTGRRRSFGKAFEDAVSCQLRFSKGAKWGRALAEVVLERKDLNDIACPAVDALRKAFMMTFSDFTHRNESSQANK